MPCLVRDPGGGTSLLLLHAWGESRKSFHRLVPLLTGCRVYGPNLRGQDDADKPLSGYSLAEQAEEAAAILDALDLPHAAVVGSSSGGYVAQQLAVAQPEKVAALVLVGSPLSLLGRPAFVDEVDALADPLDEAWVRDSLARFPGSTTSRHGYIEDRVRDGRSMPAHAWKAILNGLCEATPPTETGTVQAPTLILWGAQDNLLPREDQETLARRIPGAVLKVYPDMARPVLWECHERMAADIIGFLRSPG